MKVFWWQGGLHAEPETAEEGKAMRLLYDSIKRTSIAADGDDGPKQCTGGGRSTSRVLSDNLSEGVV